MTYSAMDLVPAAQGAVEPADEGEQFALPASYAQRRLWFLDQWSPGSPVYNVPDVVQLCGPLHVNALERALNGIIQRHEILRTAFALHDGVPVQLIAPEACLRLSLIDVGPRADMGEVLDLASAEAARPFDLSRGPLLRATLYRLSDTEHVLLISMHHIVTDGWSAGVFWRELSALYAAFRQGRPSPLLELPIQYADYALWQQEWLQGEVLEEQLAYWRRHLSGPLSTLQLPMAAPHGVSPSERGGTHTVELPGELANGLGALAQHEDVTLFMLMLVGLATLLDRYTRQHDIVIGAPIANRERAEVENVIGFFSNTLPLRLDLAGDPTSREALRRAREVCLGAYAHQDVPFEKLVELIQPERTPGVNPLFQVALTVQTDAEELVELDDLIAQPLAVDLPVAKFDLTLDVTQTRSGLLAAFNYRSDLFDAETIQRMAGHLQTLLEGMVDSPDRPLAHLPLVTPAERQELVNGWGAAKASYGTSSLLHERFAAQVAHNPNATALVYEDQRISYASLNEQAEALAHRLRALGVGPETLVAVCLERSPELIVAILGTLKAGGAYVPLDPAYPRDRLAFMIEDCQAPVIISHSQLADRVPQTEAVVVQIDVDSSSDAQRAVERGQPHGASPEAAAYVIYTSGSTGKPKGVIVTHANVTRLFDATQAWFEFDERDVWVLFHSYAFDFSVWEMWGALLYGGALVLVPYLTSRSPADFHRLVHDTGVTVLNQTPSAFRQFVLADEQAQTDHSVLPNLRLVIFGGEALDLQSLRPWFTRYGDRGPRFVNMYGITETTVHVTYRPIHMEDLDAGLGSVIGEPIPDLELYVLDQHRQLVPIGVPGELYVGGAGLARGYLNRPELTQQRFVPHPFRREPGARLYRSGDLARYLPRGELEYLGRIDHQVKLRGFRIELGEIEAALSQHEAVREAVVLLREDTPGEKRLVAYVVLHQDHALTDNDALRTHSRRLLPDYMVPATFVVLDSLLLTVNGKVDRRALRAPSAIDTSTQLRFVAPHTHTQEMLATIWAEVLEMDRVGIHDNFFALGGDSIRSVRVLTLARERGLPLTLQQQFRHQTIDSLSREVDATGSTAFAPSSPVVVVPIRTTGLLPPLFLVHAAGGGVTSYADLVRALRSDQPVYGLQSPALSNERLPDLSIESMAATYADAILSVQPHGPYYLGGWSLGGVIAFELAHVLRARGETVAGLALVDTWAPEAAEPPTEAELENLFAAAREHSTLPADLAIDDMRRLSDIFRANVTAAARYRPLTWTEPVLLVRAADSDEPSNLRLGWTDAIVPELEVVSVTGDHFTLLHTPNVEMVALTLGRWLADHQLSDS